jgi:hypothetical protein
MDGDREPEVRRQPLGDRLPGAAVVVAAQDAASLRLLEAAVILHVEAARRVVVAHDLVDALAELRVGIRLEACGDPLVRGAEGLTAVLADVVAARRDAEVDPVPVAQDRVQAQASVAGRPLARVLVIGDPRDLFPGVAAVPAPEERRRLDARPELLLPGPGSSDQMFASARPSSFEKAGADFVSLKLLPRSVERNTFIPKKGLHEDA